MAFDAGSIQATLDLDINPFTVGLDEAKAKAKEFTDNPFEAKLKLDSTEFKTELDRMKAAIDEFKNNAATATARVNVERKDFDTLLFDLRLFGRMTYTANARVDVHGEAELEALKLRLAELHDRDITVRVRTEQTGGAGGGAGGFAGIIAGIIALLPILATAITAATALLGALSVAAVIAGVGFASFAIVAVPAMAQITKALSATGKGIQSLPPYLRDAATAYQGLTKEIKNLQQAGGAEVAEALAASFRMLTSLLHSLQPVIIATAQAIEDMMIQANTFFKSPVWTGFVDFLAKNMGPVVRDITTILLSLVTGVINLTETFYKLVGAKLLDMIVAGLQQFAQWTATIGQNKAFQEWCAEMLQSLPSVIHFIGELLTFVTNLVIGLTPLGTLILNVLSTLFEQLNKIPPDFLAPIALGITAIVIAITGFGGPLLVSIVAISAVGAALTDLYNASVPFRTAVDGMVQLIANWWTPTWQRLVDLWNKYVVPAWNDLVASFQKKEFQDALHTIADIFTNYVLPALSTLGGSLVQSVIPAIISLVQAIAPLLLPVIAIALGAIATAIAAVGVAFDIAGGLAKVAADIISGNWGNIPQDFQDIQTKVAGSIDAMFGKGTSDKINAWFDGLWGPQGTIQTSFDQWKTGNDKWLADTFGSSGTIQTAFLKWRDQTNQTFVDIFGPNGTIQTNFIQWRDNNNKWLSDTFGSTGTIQTSFVKWRDQTNTTFDSVWGINGTINTGFIKWRDDNNAWLASIFGPSGTTQVAFLKWRDQTNATFVGLWGQDGTLNQNFLSWRANNNQWLSDTFGPNGTIQTSFIKWRDQTNSLFVGLFSPNGSVQSDFVSWRNTNNTWMSDTFGPTGSIQTSFIKWRDGTNSLFVGLLGPNGSIQTTFIQWRDANNAWLVSVFGPNGSIQTSFIQWRDQTNKIFADIFGPKGTVVQAVRTGIDAVRGFLNLLIGGSDSVFSALSIPINIPQIPPLPPLAGGGTLGDTVVPMMANGGTVGSGFMTNGPMAIVGEGNQRYPEFVIPTDPMYRSNALSLLADLGTRMMAAGGTIPSPAPPPVVGRLAGLTGAGNVNANSSTGDISGFVSQALAGLNALGNSNIAKIGIAVVNKIEGAITAKIQAALAALAAAAATAVGIAGPVGSAPAAAGGNVGLVQAMAAARGWTGALWNDLYAVIMRESGFNNNAQNPTSTAYGMFQFLDSTWASYGARKTSDPAGQTVAGLNYIAQRYGNPAGALAHEQQFGWYDQGGMLAPGMTLAINHTGKPERVLDANQTRKFDDAMGGGGGAGISNTEVVDKLDEVKKLLEKNGAGATFHIDGNSGDPVEIAHRSLLALRLG